jgi:peptidoglycan/xylan/chitin deacetylase (PgdA/CDA1 family)
MKLRELTILQYQNVTKDAHLHRLWLSVDAFKRQMEHLAENGFKVISINDATDYMDGKIELDGDRPISLTFDNGYSSFMEEVLPILDDHGYPATLLVSPKKVGKHIGLESRAVPYLTWDALGCLLQNDITISAYEDDHLNINKIPSDSVRQHIIEYKKRLEDKLGLEIIYHGVKEGVPKDDIRDLLNSEGYRAFLTQCPTFQKPDLFSIGRIQVDDEDFNIFLSKISRTYLFFKDKKSWVYIRKYGFDRLAHTVSETYNRFRNRMER